MIRWLDELEAAAGRATPGERVQLSGKYMHFDLGERPQVFRALTDGDEALILACSPERIVALVKLAKAVVAWNGASNSYNVAAPWDGTEKWRAAQNLSAAIDALPPDLEPGA